jgi:hypothetical protein
MLDSAVSLVEISPLKSVGLRKLGATAKDNGRCPSMTAGASAFGFMMATPMMWN